MWHSLCTRNRWARNYPCMACKDTVDTYLPSHHIHCIIPYHHAFIQTVIIPIVKVILQSHHQFLQTLNAIIPQILAALTRKSHLNVIPILI